jgi:hypothetical protein
MKYRKRLALDSKIDSNLWFPDGSRYDIYNLLLFTNILRRMELIDIWWIRCIDMERVP